MRTRAEVERKEKKAQLLKNREEFKALIAEVNYSGRFFLHIGITYNHLH